MRQKIVKNRKPTGINCDYIIEIEKKIIWNIIIK